VHRGCRRRARHVRSARRGATRTGLQGRRRLRRDRPAIAGLRRRGERARRAQVVIVGGGLEGIEGLARSCAASAGAVRSTSRWSRRARACCRTCRPLSTRGCARTVRHSAFACSPATRVTAVTPRRVRLDSGEVLRSDLTIWTGGSAPSPLLRASGLATRAGQWAEVTAALQSRRHANVFVVGDAAALPSPLSKQAYHALDMGKCAADNVSRWLAAGRCVGFRAAPKPVLVAFGDLDTFLVAGRRVWLRRPSRPPRRASTSSRWRSSTRRSRRPRCGPPRPACGAAQARSRCRRSRCCSAACRGTLARRRLGRPESNETIRREGAHDHRDGRYHAGAIRLRDRPRR